MSERIIELISNYQGIPKKDISEDSELINDLGLSSYDIVDLSCKIEDEFKVEIPDNEIKNMKTIKDIVNFIENK